MHCEFELNALIFHPNHGVGTVRGLAEKEIAGHPGNYLIVNFRRTALTLSIPEDGVERSGLRELSSTATMANALSLLAHPPAVLGGPWSRWAEEYATKLNSGDPAQLAEVLRDLAPYERGTSKSRLYDEALVRLSEELAAIEDIDLAAAQRLIEAQLHAKAPERAAG